VKAAALELGLLVTDQVEAVVDSGAEIGVVVAFGRLIRPNVLSAVPMVNVHFSMLPRWRGAAPVERAILAGDRSTGVCVMALDEGLDTGPLYRCEEVEIGPDETVDELRTRLERVGTPILLDLLRSGLGDPVAQRGEPTHAAKVEPGEYYLDWSRPAVELHRVVRLGRAWTTFRGHRLQVRRARLASVDDIDGGPVPAGRIDPRSLTVATGEGFLELVEVQPEGRATQPATVWRNGARLEADDRLGS